MFAAKKDGEQVADNDPRAWGFCMLGGIHRACHSIVTKRELVTRLEFAIHAEFPDYKAVGIIGFNDMPGRTQADILRVVDRAIALL